MIYQLDLYKKVLSKRLFLSKKEFVANIGLYASLNYLTKYIMIVNQTELISHKCINFGSSQNNKRFL